MNEKVVKIIETGDFMVGDKTLKGSDLTEDQKKKATNQHLLVGEAKSTEGKLLI